MDGSGFEIGSDGPLRILVGVDGTDASRRAGARAAVVVGASTRPGGRFVGSLAARLVRDAAWPLTVVP